MDIEKAHEIHSSALWEEVRKELDARIQSQVAKLRFCSLEELTKIQIKIACLEELKNLPQDVIDAQE